jgi:hypothetical protein
MKGTGVARRGGWRHRQQLVRTAALRRIGRIDLGVELRLPMTEWRMRTERILELTRTRAASPSRRIGR